MKKSGDKKPKMSGRMKLSFASPPPEEHNKQFIEKKEDIQCKRIIEKEEIRDKQIIHTKVDSLEERMAAFKQDEQLMNETNRFVNEVIEAATLEAARRAEQVRYFFFLLIFDGDFENFFYV